MYGMGQYAVARSIHKEKNLSVSAAVIWHCPRPADAFPNPSSARLALSCLSDPASTGWIGPIQAGLNSAHEFSLTARLRRYRALGRGPLTEPTAAVQTWRPELVFMPEAVEKRAIGGGRRAVFFGHDGRAGVDRLARAV